MNAETWSAYSSLVICFAFGCGAPTPSEPAEQLGTQTEAFNPSSDPGSRKGHVRITNKAIEVLKSRGLLPPMLDVTVDPQAQRNIAMLHYGNNFADRPDAGWLKPGAPQACAKPSDCPAGLVCVDGTCETPVPNFMTPRMRSDGTLPAGATHDDYTTFEIINDPDTGVDVGVDVSVLGSGILDWQSRPSAALRFTLKVVVSADVLLPDIPLIFDPDTQKSQGVPFAVDNMYHYGLGDLKDFKDPSIGDGETQLRSYPFYPEHIKEVTDKKAELGQFVATSLKNQGILVGADYGVTKYGAILYQLARRFFVNSTQPAPSLSDLVRVGNDVPGWHTGSLRGHGGFNDMFIEFPHSYLGGMPYVCTGYSDPSSLDTCATGSPTWPVWIIDSVAAPTPDMLGQTQNPTPPRSDRTALGYLGWAVHMMQDASLPHHVASWSGPEHQRQDDVGDADYYYVDYSPYIGKTVTRQSCAMICSGTQTQCTRVCRNIVEPDPNGQYAKFWLDPYMADELDSVFGPAWAPKSRAEICTSLGVTDDTYVGGGLNWERVQPVFLANAKKAYYARKEQLRDDAARYAGREYVKNAVLGTAKLILCAIPDGIWAPAVPNAERPRVFEHPDFVGSAQNIEPGIYDVSFAGPHNLRVGNDVISSLIVPWGYEVTLFDDSVTQSVSSLFSWSGNVGAFDNVASSLHVTRLGESGSFFIRLKRDYLDTENTWNRNFGAARYLTVWGSGNPSDDIHRPVTSSAYGSGLAEWRYDPASRAITNRHSGLCLDVTGGANENDATVQLYPCHSGDNQQWTITPSGQIKNAGGRCLSTAQRIWRDVAAVDMTDGKATTIWDCNAPDAQTWQLDYACPHDACTTGWALPASCSPDVADVCAADPYCCDTLWDSTCVERVLPKCQWYGDRPLGFAAHRPQSCGILRTDEGLRANQGAWSCDGRFQLVLTWDGNVRLDQVIHFNPPPPPPAAGGINVLQWQSGSSGVPGMLIQQGDGNLVLYDPNGVPIWANGTVGNPGAYTLIRDDGRLVTYTASGTPIWYSN